MNKWNDEILVYLVDKVSQPKSQKLKPHLFHYDKEWYCVNKDEVSVADTISTAYIIWELQVSKES